MTGQTIGIIREKVITCILAKGRGQAVLEQLVHQHGLTAVDLHFARGVGRITPLQHRGIGETSEKEVLTVAVPEEQADELFETIYEIAEINRPHGGLMYMHSLMRSTGFELPADLPEED